MMRLLLDSHAFMWFVGGSRRLSRTAREAISEKAEQVWLSHASVWELTIKRTVSRLELPEDPGQMARRAGMRLLPIELSHIRSTAALPRHHGDPFDRLLIAQAIGEDLVLVTGDATVQRYPVAWLW